MDFFLALLQDEDLTVVHACLQMCNAAVHHQPSLVAPFLEGTIGPALAARVTFKQLRKVDLGPFKQTVDDGLPLRKAALATVSTVLDAMPERFDVASFVEPLKSGLEDEKDTAMLSHQILAKVCGNPLFTACVLGCLDALVAPLLASVKKTKALMDKKLKEGQAGGTEVERLNDYVRSCVRAFLAVDAIATEDAVASSAQFKGLKELVDATESLRAMACAIKAEA